MKDNIVVYTAITGGKDKPRSDILNIDTYNKFVYPVMNAKAPKILSHQFVDADISVWIDGNIFLLIDKEKLVEEFLGDADMAVWKHPDRGCLYDEAIAAKGLFEERRPREEIDEQIKMYEYKMFPKMMGLAECNVILRRHNEKVEKFNNDWWSEICRYSQRDQISFPVAISKNKELKINYIIGNARNHQWFKYEPH